MPILSADESKNLSTQEFLRMQSCEDTHWWYQNLNQLTLDALHRFVPSSYSSLLDVGCGTGRTLNLIRSHFPALQTYGVDYSETGTQFSAAQKSYPSIVQGSGDHLPFDSESFDVVICLDVLYIQSIDEAHCLQEIFRVLKPKGICLFNVPAFNWMQSSHDKAVKTRERYTRAQLRAKLLAAGFKIEKLVYWNFFLFPFMAAYRMGKRLRSAPASDLEGMTPALAHLFLTQILKFERWLSRFIFFPFGSSVFSVVSK